MRNPKWHRDEIILALDLYYDLESGQMNSSNQKVIELSELLNKLPIHGYRPNQEKFRNPNGVNLKLGNFKFYDPDYEGKGMQGGSKLDKQILEEFYDKKELLKSIAKKIRSTISDESLRIELSNIDIEKDEDFSVKEGKVIYKLHKYRERNNKINQKKKDLYFKKNGKLDCEACGFDFQIAYGDLGKGFIEAHHRTLLSELKGEKTTKLDDLALVCSNCHRMLHKAINSMSIADLKLKLKKNVE